MLTSNLLSFFNKQPVLVIGLILILSLFLILIGSQYQLIFNLATTGNIYGPMVWEPFDKIEDKVKQTPQFIDFASKHKEIQSMGESLYHVDRKIGFESTYDNHTYLITFKILPDGSIKEPVMQRLVVEKPN